MASTEFRPFAGILTVLQRPSDYIERRDDGYQVPGPRQMPWNFCCCCSAALYKACRDALTLQMLQRYSYNLLTPHHMLAQEPECVFIVGTVHFSERSAEDAAAVIQVCKLTITTRC